MLLSYKYRLYPNREQRRVLERIVEIHRGLYNDALTERRLAWKMNRKNVGYVDQANQLKAIREFDEDAAFVNYTSIQQTLRWPWAAALSASTSTRSASMRRGAG